MIKIKGASLTPSLKFNKEVLGEDNFNKILSQLDEENQKIIKGNVLDSEWYPIDPLVNFTDVVYNTLLNKNDNALKQGSKVISAKQLTGIHKALLLLGSPEAIIEKMDSINSRYYQGIDIKTEYLDKTKLKVNYSGFEKSQRVQEIVTLGWWEAILEGVGAKNVTTELTKSLAAGTGSFEFIITWE